MIPIAKNINQAISHFLCNEGSVLCESRYGEKICKSLKEANNFFKNPPKKIRNKVRPIKTK